MAKGVFWINFLSIRDMFFSSLSRRILPFYISISASRGESYDGKKGDRDLISRKIAALDRRPVYGGRDFDRGDPDRRLYSRPAVCQLSV